jgi:uncharacterized protein
MPDHSHEPVCPICEKPTPPRADNRHFPFCSPQCKQRDLGQWFSGGYAVPGRPASPEEILQELTHSSD